VADRVNTAVKAVKTAASDAKLDRAIVEPAGVKLRDRDNAVLLSRQCRDHRVSAGLRNPSGI
jgi:hypothetical protein